MSQQPGPVLDAAVLDELLSSVEGDRSFVVDLIEAFLLDGTHQLEEIDAAVGAGDSAALIRPAHTLKSSSATVGAARLADMARSLEHAAREGRIDGPGSSEALRAAWSEAEAALRGWIGGGGQ